MQLDAVRTLTNGATDPDPGVASTISAGLVFATRARQPNSDVPNTVLVLALEAPAAESVTVDLYSVFEDQAAPQDVGNLPGSLASSRFYLVASGVVVTGSRLLAREVFLGGQIYARVTADTLTTPRKLRATCAPGQASESAGGATVVTTTQLPPALGQQTKANSLSVVLASDDHMKGQAGPASLASAAEAANVLGLIRYNATPPAPTDGQVMAFQADDAGNLKVVAPVVGQGAAISLATAARAANVLGLSRYNATPPTLTDGQLIVQQLDINGNLKAREQYAAVAEDNTNGVYATVRAPLAVATYALSNAFNAQVATNVIVKASPGVIYGRVQGYLDLAIGAGTFFILVLNEVSAVNGTRNLLRGQRKIVVPAVAVDMPFELDFGDGVFFSTGCTICVSTTGGNGAGTANVTLAAAQMIVESARYK